MNITEISKLAGKHKRRKRIGRGRGSGNGKTAGRGHKGCGSRAGWKQRGFAEGGQMPIFRRLPKRGFNNINFATRYHVVNIRELENRFDNGDTIDVESLVSARLVRNDKLPLKVLGDGGLTKKLTVVAHKFSKSAAEAIAAAGGEAKTI